MFFGLALIVAGLHLPPIEHTHPSTLWIAHIDQMSRRLVLHDLQPGQRYEIFANGRLFGSGTARSTIETIPLRTPFKPGVIITVVAQAQRGRGEVRVSDAVANDYLQYHYDLAHTGWNSAETTLTVANVNPATFGHLRSFPVDGFVYAQPLFMSGATVGNATHNVAIVATENDSVYAFDTDTGSVIWQQNYANPGAGENPIPQQAVKAYDIAPTVGITSTPAIDPTTNVIFFVAAIQQNTGSGYTYHQFLHEVNLNDGTDVPGSPVDITATAFLNNNMPVVFDPQWQLNRASILLANGLVYVSFGSHNDVRGGHPHGWIMAYNESDLSLASFFNSTLDVTTRYFGSIWAAGWGPSMDEFGNIYVATGDGPFDGNTGGNNWGDTVLKLSGALTIQDYFTPQDQAQLQIDDHDLGGGGVLVLPDQPGAFPHLAVQAGLEGTIYLLNRDAMGGYTEHGQDNVVQELPSALGTLRGGPTYYSGPTGTFLYYCGNGNPLYAFNVQTSPQTALVLSSQTNQHCGTGGTIPAVSSNGSTPGTGIVWFTNRPGNKVSQQVTLFAYDATNLQTKLIALPVAYWTNLKSQPFLAVTVAGGRVFVGTPNSVEEYGLIGTRNVKRR